MAAQTPVLPNGRPEPGQILLVIHDFTARSSDELSLAKGDRVKLIERDDEFGDGWYLGDHITNGERGLFPEVYTKPAPRGLPATRLTAQAPTSGGGIPRSYPAAMQPAIKPVAVSNPIPDSSAFDSRKSVPVPEPDRTQQLSRHVSASEVHNNPTNTPPLITVKKSEDSSETAPSSSPAKTSPQQSMGVSAGAPIGSHDLTSPVMNETLSVIQEHISDMNTPRHSIRDRHSTNDSGSEYSSNIDRPLSYINGEETDEEEEIGLTEDEVSQWTPDQVAEYLGSVDVDTKHCQVFRDQEITGDVLLGMDQTSIMLPQFELGPLGRRLKVWQRIKALQDEVKSMTPATTRRTTQTYENSDFGSEDAGRSQNRTRSHTTNASLQKRPSAADRPGSRQNVRYSQQQQTGRSNSMQAISPTKANIQERMTKERSATMTMTIESPTRPTGGDRRPSAASIRDLNHSRRYSSNDYGSNILSASLSGTGPDSSLIAPSPVHKKAPSFDKNWTMGSRSPGTPARPLSSSGEKLLENEEGNGLNGVTLTTPWEFDRGYFSGGDVDNRQRNVLRKRGTSGGTHVHSRNSSYADEQIIRTGTASARHSRFGSVDSIQEQHRSPASQKYYGQSGGRRRTPSSGDGQRPAPPAKDLPSPTVTKLDGSSSLRGTDSPRSPDQVQSPPWVQGGNQVASPRGTISLRAASDAVTGGEKSRVIYSGTDSPIKEDSLISPSRTGSTTSGGPDFEMDSPNTSKSPSTMTTPGAKSSRKKSKKETSAYTRGLEKKTPQEQMIGADYSGWMKKKSTNLMTTWKPRLFVLKGRRLSYYYSENDTEEKGLIDISFHRVLPADNDRITGLHATLTRATTSPTSPSNSHTPTIASQQAAAEPTSSLSLPQADHMFIFKLVPPRAGLSRAVNFTKPTVHYFAVPNITLGRLWMAALMKATIDRDDTAPITTTYQQKTISLEKARRMRHRPPALMNLDEKAEDEPIKTPGPDLTGLNIRGIIFDQEPYEGDSGVSGLSKPDSKALTKTGSNSDYPGGLNTSAPNGEPPSYSEPTTA